MWFPLTEEQVDTHFSSLKQEVLKARRNSRSKHKDHDKDEYEWGIDYCIGYRTQPCNVFNLMAGLPQVHCTGPQKGQIGAALRLNWKFNSISSWAVGIPGPNGTNDIDDCFEGPGLSNLLKHYGIAEELDE